MIITGKELEKPTEGGIIAKFQIVLQDMTLKSFSLIKNKEGQYNVILPATFKKDAEGNIMTDAFGKKQTYKQIQINTELNSKKLLEQLKELVIKAYNNKKPDGTFEINEKCPELENGQMRVLKMFVYNKTNNEKLPESLKANYNVLIGAFQVNNNRLYYSNEKNDYYIKAPYYKTTNSANENIQNSYFIPNNDKKYAELKALVSKEYNTNKNEFKKKINEQQQAMSNIHTNVETEEKKSVLTL